MLVSLRFDFFSLVIRFFFYWLPDKQPFTLKTCWHVTVGDTQVWIIIKIIRLMIAPCVHADSLSGRHGRLRHLKRKEPSLVFISNTCASPATTSQTKQKKTQHNTKFIYFDTIFIHFTLHLFILMLYLFILTLYLFILMQYSFIMTLHLFILMLYLFVLTPFIDFETIYWLWHYFY